MASSAHAGKIDAATFLKWREAGLISDLSLRDAAENAAASWPDARLVIWSATRPAETSLEEFSRRVKSIAAGLFSLGIRKGDVVAAQLPNWMETVLLHAAVAALGGCMLPMIHIYRAAELGFILRQSNAKIFVSALGEATEIAEKIRRECPALMGWIVIGGAASGCLSWDDLETATPIEPDNSVGPEDVTLLVYTSGTTGQPKGVCHSARGTLAELTTYRKRYGSRGTALCPWPAGHVAGYNQLASFWLYGCNLVTMDKWDGAVAASLIHRHRITYTSGTPFHLATMLDAAAETGTDISSLKDYLLGATMVPPAAIERCEKLGITPYRAYGLSEHPTISSGSVADPLEKRLLTSGPLCPGVEVRIIDDADQDVPVGEAGEIVSRGPDCFIGYREPALDAAAFLPGGWFRTGDIGVMDSDGFLSITDRKKDIIIRGGENIASREVEDLLVEMPGIAEAAVVGFPDARYGEKVAAFLRMREGTVTIAEIDQFFRLRGVARQKTPEKIILVDEMPRNAAGKILKPALRAMLVEAAVG